MRRFEGKTALVTGGRSGIGQAIARRLRSEGARVFTAQRGPDDEFEGIAADFTDPISATRVIGEVINRAGRLEVLVNNAGMMQKARIEDMTVEESTRNRGAAQAPAASNTNPRRYAPRPVHPLISGHARRQCPARPIRCRSPSCPTVSGALSIMRK